MSGAIVDDLLHVARTGTITVWEFRLVLALVDVLNEKADYLWIIFRQVDFALCRFLAVCVSTACFHWD